MAELPPPPPWMDDLPALHHPRAKAFAGLPSHAASEWVDGKPIFSVDARKMRIAAIRGRCWQCGYPLEPPGYVIVTAADRNDSYGDLHTQAFGPLHASCSLYAALACPFLRYPTSRRRTTGHNARGTARIQGYGAFGVFFPPGPITFTAFGYYRPTETVPLTDRTQVAELYEQAVTADAAANFTATPRLSWTDTPDDMRRLTAEWSGTKKQLQGWARTSVVTIGGRDYRGHALHDGLLVVG